jgi:hypothetical protein
MTTREHSKEIFYNRKANSKKFYKIHAKCIGEFQIDLLIWDAPDKFKETDTLDRWGKYNALDSKKRTRDGEYIIVVVDVFSRMADARLMSRKEADDTLKAYKAIIRNPNTFDGFIPYQITCDSGSEFKSSFKRFCDEKDTDIIIAKGDGTQDTNRKLKTSIAERFNRTLRQLLNYEILGKKGRNKITQDIIDKCIQHYNHTNSKSVNAKPYNVFWNGTIPKQVVRKYNIEGKNNKAKLKYEIGDHVRVQRQFQKMSKNSKREIIYSKKVYEIVERDKHRYVLNDGSEYPYSRLLKTKANVG